MSYVGVVSEVFPNGVVHVKMAYITASFTAACPDLVIGEHVYYREEDETVARRCESCSVSGVRCERGEGHSGLHRAYDNLTWGYVWRERERNARSLLKPFAEALRVIVSTFFDARLLAAIVGTPSMVDSEWLRKRAAEPLVQQIRADLIRKRLAERAAPAVRCQNEGDDDW